jgi:hypothetical protein
MKINRAFNGPVVFLITVSLAVGVVAQGWPNQPLYGEQESRTQNLEAGLKKGGSALIDSILNENAEGIVALWSASGVAVGIDGPVLSTSEIKMEFQTRSKSFCIFFNTDCLRTQAGFERKYCYKDLLSKAETRTVSYRMEKDGKSLIGEMSVNLRGGPIEPLKAANPLEFDFQYENGHWKLVSLPAI